MKVNAAHFTTLLLVAPAAVAGLNFRHADRKLMDTDEITVFTFRQAWEGALVGQDPEWCVDFERVITEDLDFRFIAQEFRDNNGSVGTTRFSLIGNGPSNNDRLNKIDVAPFETAASDGDISDGSNYARIHVEGDSDITVVMSFDGFGDDRVVAWGGSFRGTQTNENMELELHFESGLVVTDNFAPNGNDGFFGFTLKTELLKSIRFKADIPDGNLGGETFALDDVCATATRPSPAPSSTPSAMPSIKPSASPTARPSASPSRSPTRAPTEQDFCFVRNIPIIGPIICFFFDVISDIFF